LFASMGGLVVLAASLAVFQLVVLRLLPFDNKSELQEVVDLPEGRTLEDTAALLTELTRCWNGCRKCATGRPTPAPPRRSTSTAWCASTTCAPAPTSATCR